MRLWIIGNGFDLYHGLKTGYLDYKSFLCQLKKDCKDVVCINQGDQAVQGVCRYCCKNEFVHRDCPVRKFLALPRKPDVLREELWRDLEEACTIDFAKLMEGGRGYYKRDPDSKTNMPLVGNEHKTLDFAEAFTGDLFYRWLKKVDESLQGNKKEFARTLLDVNRSGDLFITFNYTRTIQELYDVSEGSRVFYIHGDFQKAYERVDELHKQGCTQVGKDVHEILAFGSPDVTEEALDDAIAYYKATREHISDEDEETLRREGRALIKLLNKDVLSHLKDLRKFVADHSADLKSVEEVVVAGHSLGRIDEPYFDYLTKELACKKWCFLYREGKDIEIERALAFCKKHNLVGTCIPWKCMERSFSGSVQCRGAGDSRCPHFTVCYPKPEKDVES